jgi:hypothetical protein
MKDFLGFKSRQEGCIQRGQVRQKEPSLLSQKEVS